MPSCLRLDQNVYFWIMLFLVILQNKYIALFVLLPGFYFLDQLQEIYLGSFAWRLTRLRALHVKSEGRVWTKESVIVTPREMSLIQGNLQRLDRPKNLNHRDFFGRPLLVLQSLFKSKRVRLNHYKPCNRIQYNRGCHLPLSKCSFRTYRILGCGIT